jgi:hypothetical protein
MAARRLLIVMLVLLGLSTLAAALVPPRTTQDGTTTTATEETGSVPKDTVPGGELLDPVQIAASPPVEVIPVGAGDQLPLMVSSRKADLVEIPGLGLSEPVAPAKAARFNVLVETPGSYGVRLVTADRVVARIEVNIKRVAP